MFIFVSVRAHNAHSAFVSEILCAIRVSSDSFQRQIKEELETD